ncbi:hypothetical protein NY2A_b306L [Paramecium bursaria Chlorella virus NY2A]|uniref:Uncharacterized protein b306L n=1 Tax=Paramecium bursaria Chlorella virus NY2A TaxID=46021 RepID=A7IWI1_PBCVN|nr:hypothetical protein NY2A_b306L [Paramecium bursaria Chlorella virus NY2A]ABT14705.1 hypothetical protein NY2A_b306L [Paramecium bursaria Chlorella virus NY2A]
MRNPSRIRTMTDHGSSPFVSPRFREFSDGVLMTIQSFAFLRLRFAVFLPVPAFDGRVDEMNTFFVTIYQQIFCVHVPCEVDENITFLEMLIDDVLVITFRHLSIYKFHRWIFFGEFVDLGSIFVDNYNVSGRKFEMFFV